MYLKVLVFLKKKDKLLSCESAYACGRNSSTCWLFLVIFTIIVSSIVIGTADGGDSKSWLWFPGARLSPGRRNDDDDDVIRYGCWFHRHASLCLTYVRLIAVGSALRPCACDVMLTIPEIPQCDVKVSVRSSSWELIHPRALHWLHSLSRRLELRSVTCYIVSHSVTCTRHGSVSIIRRSDSPIAYHLSSLPVNVFNKTVTIAVYSMSIESLLRITQWIN